MDPWMDAAHRGVTALAERGQEQKLEKEADQMMPRATRGERSEQVRARASDENVRQDTQGASTSANRTLSNSHTLQKLAIENRKLQHGTTGPGTGEKSKQDKPHHKRLVFYGGSKTEDALFKRAADNVNKDYDIKVKPDDFIKIETASTIIDAINAQSPNVVKSIDIFSHGGRDELFFTHREWLGDNDLYKTQEKETEEAGYWWNNSGALDDIDYKAFTDDAKIEIHGCATGSIDEGMDEPFAQVWSRKLGDAGKTRAVVIAHATKANPDKHKTLQGDDYRHGLRRAFHNGEVLFTTRKEGEITESDIEKFLTLKKKGEKEYDGTKQVLK